MSTNDEIRKAVAAELDLQSYFGSTTDAEYIAVIHGKLLTRILTAFAPYLAPHPAQQEEDGELLDWLEGERRVEVTIDTRAFNGVPSLEKIELKGDIRAAIRAARSHSKQEGGA